MSDLPTESHEDVVNSWFSTEYPRIWAFIRSRLPSESDADDVAQQTYLRARSGTFRPGSELDAWVFAIAANLVRDHFRRKKTGASALEDVEQIPDPLPENTLTSMIDSEESRRRKAAFKNCLGELSHDEFSVVKARMRGESHQAISAALDWVSPNRSEKTLLRAKSKLTLCVRAWEKQ